MVQANYIQRSPFFKLTVAHLFMEFFQKPAIRSSRGVQESTVHILILRQETQMPTQRIPKLKSTVHDVIFHHNDAF